MSIKRKGIIFIILLILLLPLLNRTQADAYVGAIFTYTYEGQTITYEVLSEPTVTEHGTAKIIYSQGIHKDLAGEVTIPSIVMNQKMIYNVTRIEPIAFMDANDITAMTLPETITEIGMSAFQNCSSLTRINIPQGITRFEEGVFAGCIGLQSIQLPNGLTYIGDMAFYHCNSLYSIQMPESVTYIGNDAFTDCYTLSSINLPQRLKYLGSAAFSGCSNLIEINIPEDITRIENRLFQDCIRLTLVSLPEGITSIGDSAFSNCTKLRNVYLSENISRIGDSAFYMCESLTAIKIPYAVSKINNYTFTGCSSLAKIIIQDKVTSIGDFAFLNCSSLISLELPEGLKSIGIWSFYGCDIIRPITIPSNVSSIGNGEFPYTGVFVYHNSYAETFFQTNFPKYYQVIKLPLEDMTFPEEIKNIRVNETVQLQPLFYPKYSSEITDTIHWSSSNPYIVAVDTNGSIQGLMAGEADVVALMGDHMATCHIIVGGTTVLPTSVEFSQAKVVLNKNQSVMLPLKFTPSDTTNRFITWTSSDDSVVTVDHGRIYANNPGTAVITARSVTSTTVCSITVLNPLRGIDSDLNLIVLNKGETKKVTVSFDPMDTTDNKTIIWRSGDNSIATVSNGILSALKPGNTEITAAVGAFTKTIPVVIQNPITNLSISPELVLTVGQTLNLPITVTPIDTTDPLLVTSSDEAVVRYSSGKITAIKRGKATLTVTAGALSAVCVVTVDTDIEQISLDRSSLDLYLGSSEALTVNFNPLEALDDKSILWTSSDEKAVVVDSEGRVKTVGTGTAFITATAGGNKIATCTVKVKLALPSAFKVTSGGYDSAKLSWGLTSGAYGYRIYRADQATGTFVRIKDTKLSSYTDTGLIAGNTYYYKIRAYCYQGTQKVYSSYTKVISAKPIPATPANVKLVKLSSTKVNFTWSQVSGATGYEIYRASSKTGTFQLVKTTTSFHYMNYGLSKGRTYYYKVRAYKTVGKLKVYSKFSVEYAVKI